MNNSPTWARWYGKIFLFLLRFKWCWQKWIRISVYLFTNSFIYKNTHIYSSPLELGGVLIFKIWTKRGGVMKKLLRNRGLVERGGGLLERRISKLFYQFLFRKSCFHYYWNTFFLKRKFHFLLLLFLNKILWNFYYQWHLY